ncbi:uncharacterized protein LOC126319969 isoform X2 [Schistocerca gregaria]|uniref:uncharacterized protein LOC126319969 isoform X2 n=1 Tax=Schistocerca gregaria TaxID=7010 RepID=UPI00211DCD8A|nr:uncharacterized protein LOC126319969 isoform X2 [Schistocerca gregaria]
MLFRTCGKRVKCKYSNEGPRRRSNRLARGCSQNAYQCTTSEFFSNFNCSRPFSKFCTTKVGEFDLPEVATALGLVDQGKHVQAEPFILRALAVCENCLGEHSAEYAELSFLMACVKFHTNKIKDTIFLLRRLGEKHLQDKNAERLEKCIFNISLCALKVTEPNVALVGDALQFVESAQTEAAISPVLLDLCYSTQLKLRAHKYYLETIAGKHSASSSTLLEISTVIESATEALKAVADKRPVKAEWTLTYARWLLFYEKDEKLLNVTKELFLHILATQKEALHQELLHADALLGLGELEIRRKQWDSADEYLRKVLEITDKYKDRDALRVRKIVGLEAIVQFRQGRWIYAEGLLRRLINQYTDAPDRRLTQSEAECVKYYFELMKSRGDDEVTRQRLQLNNVVPDPPFDADAFIWKK